MTELTRDTFPEAWLRKQLFHPGTAPGQWRYTGSGVTLLYHEGVWWIQTAGGQPARLHGIRTRKQVLRQMEFFGD